MHIAPKAPPLLLMAVLLTACGNSASTPAAVQSETTEIQTAPSATLPVPTPLPPTETPVPGSSIPVTGIPAVMIMENGLTWTECVVPPQDFANQAPDIDGCFDTGNPAWDDRDRSLAGERIDGRNGSDLQQVIGNDVYLARHDSTNGCCDYDFLVNGEVTFEISASLITFDPNRNLWNVGGKAAWEIIADPPTIIVDGVNFTEEYRLEGAYMPYPVHDRLLYIAKENGRYHVVYDGQVVGPEFDQIYIRYCCGTTTVHYGAGRYRFWGQRDGTYYVIEIH